MLTFTCLLHISPTTTRTSTLKFIRYCKPGTYETMVEQTRALPCYVRYCTPRLDMMMIFVVTVWLTKCTTNSLYAIIWCFNLHEANILCSSYTHVHTAVYHDYTYICTILWRAYSNTYEAHVISRVPFNGCITLALHTINLYTTSYTDLFFNIV